MAKSGKRALRIAIEDWLQTFALGNVLSRWFSQFGEDEEAKIAAVNDDLYKILRETPGVPDVLRGLAGGDKSGLYQGGAATALSFAVGVGQQAAGGMLGPISRKLGQAADSKIRSMIPDIGALLAMRRRGAISDATYWDIAAKLGWPEDFTTAWEIASTPLLSPGDLLALWRRDVIDWGRVNEMLSFQGWQSEEIEQMRELSNVIPGISDLIGMAVREAFNEDTVAKFGYDEDFPSDILEYTKTHGLSDEWVQRSWRAHWVLPGVAEGFEMYHRLRPGTTDNPLGDNELEMLLRAKDIPRFWRERLKEIAYQPLTRVDVRRMHGEGVLTREEVLASYLDLGYNAVNAERMTDFTVKYNTGETKSLSRTAITQGYKRGVLSYSDALTSLISCGYSEDDASFHLALVDWEIERDRVDAESDLVKALYIDGEITKSESYSQLTALNFPTERIETLLTDWELDRRRKIRLPSENELEIFYLTEVIDRDEYEIGLVARRYSEKSIPWFVFQADKKKAALADEKETKALEKKKLLEDEATVDEYRLARADRDVKIAERKSGIADLKVLAYGMEDENSLDEIGEIIITLKAQIKELELEKAVLHLEIETEL